MSEKERFEAWAKAEGLSLKDFYVGTPDDPAYNEYTTFLAWEAWQAAQAAPVEPCCGDYFNCQRPCTPRGRELEKREHTTPPAEGVPTNGTVIELAAKTAEVERLREIETAACKVFDLPVWSGEDFYDSMIALKYLLHAQPTEPK